MTDNRYQPGQRVLHADFGEGIVVSAAANGYLRVFFAIGERQVFGESLRPAATRAEQIINNVQGGADRLRNAWLHVEAKALPFMDNSAA